MAVLSRSVQSCVEEENNLPIVRIGVLGTPSFPNEGESLLPDSADDTRGPAHREFTYADMKQCFLTSTSGTRPPHDFTSRILRYTTRNRR